MQCFSGMDVHDLGVSLAGLPTRLVSGPEIVRFCWRDGFILSWCTVLSVLISDDRAS